jgi:hypothetical protein
LAYPYTEDEDLTELDMQGTPWYARSFSCVALP